MTNIRWKIAQWFELRWWKNYLYGKSKEEYLSWKKQWWGSILSMLPVEMQIWSDAKIIDLGCGPSGVFMMYGAYDVTAVDPLIEEYEKQTPFFSRKNFPNVKFVKSTIEEFEPKEKFDFVFCMNAINHVRDFEKAMDVLVDCVGERRNLVLTIDAHNLSFFKKLFRAVPGDILHPHQYDLVEYQSFLEKRGIKILKSIRLKHEFFFDHYLIVAKS